MARVDQLAIVARHPFQNPIGGLDEDLRTVPGVPEDALNSQHLMADRVTVGERGEHLMNCRRSRCHHTLLERWGWPWRPRRRRSWCAAGARDGVDAVRLDAVGPRLT